MAWYQVCNVEDVPLSAGREFMVAGRVLAVFRTGESMFAVDGMCAHQGGPIAQGTLNEKCVTCPWHGWQYDVETGSNVLTKRKMLDTFPIELRGETVWVQCDAPELSS